MAPYPISHQVYTIPKRIRPYLRFNRALNRHLYHAAWGVWTDRIDDEFPDCQGGAILALHSSGELLNFHPHAHALMLRGAIDQESVFHRLHKPQLEYLTRCFQQRVLQALLKEKLLEQDTVDNMLSWEHSGFHVFVGEPIEPSAEEARLFVARYLKKSPP